MTIAAPPFYYTMAWLFFPEKTGIIKAGLRKAVSYEGVGAMMDTLPICRERYVQSFSEGTWSSFTDYLVVEEHLQIILNGEKLVSVACSPEHTRELAVGYLVSEGFISSYQDLVSVNVPHPLQVEVETTKR